MSNLTVRRLTLSINQEVLIKEFSLRFHAGKIYALVGNNGSGKTTLLKTLAGLNCVKPDQILIDDDDLASLSLLHRAQTISFLMQVSPEQPYCIALSRIAHGLMPTYGYRHFIDERTLRHIDVIAQRLNIHHLLHRPLAKMSGGERRLVHIAKCLINPSTKILLLDEPSVFLDFTQQNNLLNNLKEQATLGRTIIFSSHDREFIRRAADEVAVIHHREIAMTKGTCPPI